MGGVGGLGVVMLISVSGEENMRWMNGVVGGVRVMLCCCVILSV